MDAPPPFALLSELPGHEEAELTDLARLQAAGFAVAPVMVVPAIEEEYFYRHANLVPQLTRLFREVNPADPDEEDLEDLVPEAMRLIRESYLLDEVIDRFYDSLAALPASLRLRRAGTAGLTAARGRPALLALKHLWAAVWSLDQLQSRLDSQKTFSLEARPVLVHGADVPAEKELAGEVASLLERRLPVFVTGTGLITRLG